MRRHLSTTVCKGPSHLRTWPTCYYSVISIAPEQGYNSICASLWRKCPPTVRVDLHCILMKLPFVLLMKGNISGPSCKLDFSHLFTNKPCMEDCKRKLDSLKIHYLKIKLKKADKNRNSPEEQHHHMTLLHIR